LHPDVSRARDQVINFLQLGCDFQCCVENGYDQVDLYRPWNESKSQLLVYRDVLLSQQMLPAIKHAAGDTFVFQQHNVPSHHANDTIKQPLQETPDFIGPKQPRPESNGL